MWDIQNALADSPELFARHVKEHDRQDDGRHEAAQQSQQRDSDGIEQYLLELLGPEQLGEIVQPNKRASPDAALYGIVFRGKHELQKNRPVAEHYQVGKGNDCQQVQYPILLYSVEDCVLFLSLYRCIHIFRDTPFRNLCDMFCDKHIVN